jgi:hypothetical protein
VNQNYPKGIQRLCLGDQSNIWCRFGNDPQGSYKPVEEICIELLLEKEKSNYNVWKYLGGKKLRAV